MNPYFCCIMLPDFGLSRCFTRCFCPQAAQICAICVKAAFFEVFAEFDMSETCLRHVKRPLVSTHQGYLRNLHEYCEMLRLNIKAYSQMFRLSNSGCQKICLEKT